MRLDPIDLRPATRADAYAFIARTLQRFDYRLLGKADKGLFAPPTGQGRPTCHAPRSPGWCANTGPRARLPTAAMHRGDRSPAATPMLTSACWPRPTCCTARCPARPRASCAPAPGSVSATSGVDPAMQSYALNANGNLDGR